MVRIGNSAGGAKQIKERASRQNKQWLSRIGKEDLRVRVLQPPELWTEYQEHYTDKYKFTPCGKEYGLDCPPCESQIEKEQRTSTRYVVNCLDVKEGKVIPLKIPLTLANKLTERFERRGTLFDRDYTLMKIGTGLDTDYDLEAEERTTVDIDRYTSDFHDVPELLGNIYEEAFGTTTVIGSAKVEDKVAPATPEEEKFPFDSGSSEPDGEFITEADMQKMEWPSLEEIAKQIGVEVDMNWDKDDLIEAILAKGTG